MLVFQGCSSQGTRNTKFDPSFREQVPEKHAEKQRPSKGSGSES